MDGAVEHRVEQTEYLQDPRKEIYLNTQWKTKQNGLTYRTHADHTMFHTVEYITKRTA